MEDVGLAGGTHCSSHGESNENHFQPGHQLGTLASTQAVTWKLCSTSAPPSPSVTGRTQGHARRRARNRSQVPAFLCLNNPSSEINLLLSFWCVRNSTLCPATALTTRCPCREPQVPWEQALQMAKPLMMVLDLLSLTHRFSVT